MGAEVADHWEVSIPVFMGTVKTVKYYRSMIRTQTFGFKIMLHSGNRHGAKQSHWHCS